jgi:hypothetical protein
VLVFLITKQHRWGYGSMFPSCSFPGIYCQFLSSLEITIFLGRRIAPDQLLVYPVVLVGRDCQFLMLADVKGTIFSAPIFSQFPLGFPLPCRFLVHVHLLRSIFLRRAWLCFETGYLKGVPESAMQRIGCRLHRQKYHQTEHLNLHVRPNLCM